MRIITAIGMLAMAAGWVCAADANELMIAPGHVVAFADESEGRALLGASDAFTSAMGSLEISIRLQTTGKSTEKDYLEFAASSVRNWRDTDISAISAMITKLKPVLEPVASLLPERLLVINSTCKEEGGGAYTRGSAIIIDPQTMPPGEIAYLFVHELFHVITRRTPALRDSLYANIGFERCDRVELPEEIRPIRLTNPDSWELRHYVEVTVEDHNATVVPIIFSRWKEGDPKCRRGLFASLKVAFMSVEKKDGRWQVSQHDGRTVLLREDEIGGLMEKTGGNTGYIIHPEEICADNFAHHLCGHKSLQSPETAAKIYKTLCDGAAASRATRETATESQGQKEKEAR